jgi:hypothetical protein
MAFLEAGVWRNGLAGWRGMPRSIIVTRFLLVWAARALIAVSRAIEFVFRHWPTPHRSFPADFGTDFDSYLRAFRFRRRRFCMTDFCVADRGVGGFVLAHCKSPLIRACSLWESLALVSGWGSPADFLKQWLAQLIFLRL